MKLPNRENAYIPSGKLTEYLLSETHAHGRGKALFFRGVGFDETNTDALVHGLLAIAQTEEVADTEQTRHGTKYVIEGPLETPAGETVHIRTVWIIDVGQERPRLVTAYPAK